MLWKLKPEIKVLVGDADFEFHKYSLSIDVFLLENAISRVGVTASDEQARNYLRRARFLDTVDVQLRYGDEDEDWTTVFGGNIEDLNPTMSPSTGQTLTLSCYGYGRSLRLTHCGEDYGKESENPTIDTPSEIITDLADNRVEKDFDGDTTGFTLDGTTKVKSLTNPTVYHVMGGFRKNIDILNETLLLYQAYQAGSAGVHWRVDPSKNLWVDTIAAHSVDTDVWPTYWNWGATESTLQQKRDIKQLSLGQIGRNYANKILLCTDFRVPGYDYWSEGDAATLWGHGGDVEVDATAATKLVGTHALRYIVELGDANQYFYYPTGQNLGWDVTQLGSYKNPPRINFYAQKDDDILWSLIYLCFLDTTFSMPLFAGANDLFYTQFDTGDPTDEWVWKSIPFGPYWSSVEDEKRYKWSEEGAPSWSDINGILFYVPASGGGGAERYYYVDDIHITGKLIREAEDTSEMTAYGQHQKIIKMDTSVSDTLKASDDVGTAGRLAYAELLRSITLPVRGTVRIPLCPQMMPGQLAPIKYGLKSNGTYQIDDTFRIQQVHHHFGDDDIYTELTVTDDLVNTFAYGPSEALSSLAKALYVDPEAKSLKTTGIDTLVSRLSKAY